MRADPATTRTPLRPCSPAWSGRWPTADRSRSTTGRSSASRRVRRPLARPAAAGPGAARAWRTPQSHAFHRALRGRTQAPTAARLVLDVARADVLRRRTASTPTAISHWPAPSMPRWRWRHHHGRRVPLPAPRHGRPPVRRPERDGRCARRRLRATPGCASPCWTPAISPAGSADRWRECRDGSATAARRLGGAGRRSARRTTTRRRRHRGGHSLRPRRAARPSGTVADWAAAHAAPLHMHLSEQRAENDACLDRHGDARPGCCTTTAHSARAAAPCTRPI